MEKTTMNKPRLYLDFGKGYEKDKADTFTKIINRLEQVQNDVDKYMVISEIKCKNWSNVKMSEKIGKYTEDEIFEDYECFKNDCKKYKEVIDKLKTNIENDIDGFRTINEFGESNEILELLDIYLDILKEVE